MKKLIKRILRESVNQMIVEEQLLTESYVCNPGTQGTSCSDFGHIWCDFAAGAAHGCGVACCLCVTPKQCNQAGTNEDCVPKGMVREPGNNSPACPEPSTDKLNVKSRDRLKVPMSRDNDKMMREVEDLELEPSLAKGRARCYKCFEMPHGGRCKRQQFTNGKCDGGWTSSRKCERKCKKRHGMVRGPSEPSTPKRIKY